MQQFSTPSPETPCHYCIYPRRNSPCWTILDICDFREFVNWDVKVKITKQDMYSYRMYVAVSYIVTKINVF